MSFKGTYEHLLDAKNRLTIPAHHRERLQRTGVTLTKGIERCVGIWEPEAYAEFVTTSLGALSPLGSERRQLERYFNANSFDTDLDSAGRVLLPPPLIEHAGIDKEVTISGVGPRLEIWDRGEWAKLSAELDETIPAITQALGGQA